MGSCQLVVPDGEGWGEGWLVIDAGCGDEILLLMSLSKRRETNAWDNDCETFMGPGSASKSLSSRTVSSCIDGVTFAATVLN